MRTCCVAVRQSLATPGTSKHNRKKNTNCTATADCQRRPECGILLVYMALYGVARAAAAPDAPWRGLHNCGSCPTSIVSHEMYTHGTQCHWLTVTWVHDGNLGARRTSKPTVWWPRHTYIYLPAGKREQSLTPARTFLRHVAFRTNQHCRCTPLSFTPTGAVGEPRSRGPRPSALWPAPFKPTSTKTRQRQRAACSTCVHQRSHTHPPPDTLPSPPADRSISNVPPTRRPPSHTPRRPTPRSRAPR